METVDLNLFGSDPKVLKAVSSAKNVSVTKAPVLIAGEVGVGKKTLGRFIHQNSNRASGAFETVDCSLPADEVEAKILGHRDSESGRFIKGVLEMVNGGTVMLLNVDCIAEEFQKRFHNIICELDDYDLDIRFISTTTKNLSKLVGVGRFYRGLYTTLSANSINLGPLRERPEDIQSLTLYLLQNSENEVQISELGMNKLLSHYWTHNVEELKAVIETSLEKLEGEVLDEDQIMIGERRTTSMMSDDESEGIRLMSLKDAEKLLIKKALIHTSENRTQAAKILGVSIRTLRNKINEYRTDGNSFFLNLR